MRATAEFLPKAIAEPVDEAAKHEYSTSSSPRHVSVLPLDVVQRIASGEVIISFASVVQELVENAIDASASDVAVSIDFVSSSVTVTDNGVGISMEQGLALVARCNATSKLRSVHELRKGVSTLGFRGQGLWAIAARGKGLVIASRTEDALHGTSIAFSRNGEAIPDSVSPSPMAVGTVATVRGLPWSLIGREQSKAVQKCKTWLLRTALCHPTISFQLKRGRKLCWQSVYGNGAQGEIRLQSLAKELKISPSEFRHGSASFPGQGAVDVVIGLPSRVHTSSRTWIVTALNGRSVAMETLSCAIIPLFNVPRGRFPVVFVNILVPGGCVDWNISPMKANVGFKSSQLELRVVDAVTGVIKDLMQGLQKFQPDTVSDYIVGFPRLSSRKPNALQTLLSSMASGLKFGDGKQHGLDKKDASGNPELPIGLAFNARVVAQVLRTYILIESDGGILLVEQHVADERALYEKLLKEWKDSPFSLLREPVWLPSALSDEAIFSLSSLGFDVESVGDIEERAVESAYFVSRVPKMMSEVPQNELKVLILRLCSEATTIENAAASVACKLAVRNGTFLHQQRMVSIITELMDCKNPHTCPHGRPVFVELGVRDLARLFGRSWTPERFEVSELGHEAGNLPMHDRKSQGTLPE